MAHKKSVTESGIKINLKNSPLDSNLLPDLPKLS